MRYLLLIILLVASQACAATTFSSREVLTASKLNTALTEKADKVSPVFSGNVEVHNGDINFTNTGTPHSINNGVITIGEDSIRSTGILTISAPSHYITSSSDIEILSGGSLSQNALDMSIQASNYIQIYASTLYIHGNTTAPTTSSDTCTTNEMRIADKLGVTYIFYCITTNTWRRAALSTW